MQTETLRDPDALRRRIAELTDHPSPASDALAEAHFRVAIHPETERSDALASLFQAVRLDSANPKFAYHLARFFFVHGELAHAAEWLKRAARLSPTSHRIVAHIALLQRELNERYKNDSRYDANALQERSERLATAIREGKDAFAGQDLDTEPKLGLATIEANARMQSSEPGSVVPLPRTRDGSPSNAAPPGEPASSDRLPPRMERAATCRWSGVIDVEAEWLLGKSPTAHTRDKLIPLLEQIAARASQRVGGTAGFAVLAIQWLIAGYSLDTLRRIGDRLLDELDDPAILLLDRVIRTFELVPSGVAPVLAELVRTGHMPPLLAAAIHLRRLLWQPMTFGAISAFTKARTLLVERPSADRENEGANEKGASERSATMALLLKELNAAVQAFFPAPSQPVPDASVDETAGQHSDPAAATNSVRELRDHAAELQVASEVAFQFLKKDLEPRSKALNSPEQIALARADHDLYEELLAALARALDTGLARLHTLAAGVTSSSAKKPADGDPQGADVALTQFLAERDACQQIYDQIQSPGSFTKALKRVSRNLSAHAQPPAAQPSAALTEVLARLKSAVPEQASGTTRAPESGSGGPAPRLPAAADSASTTSSPYAPPVASSELASAVDQVLHCISSRFEQLDASLDPYGTSLRDEPSLRALRQLVRSRHAELLYRIGEVAAARRMWASLIHIDPVSPAPRKNLAVLDTIHGDTARSLAAWQAYAESLYLFPLSSGDPLQMADPRIELHTAFAEAQVPPCCLRPVKKAVNDEEQQARRRAIRQMVSDERAFASFVAHKRLELVTRKLNARSPSILLGVARDATDKHRDHAAARLTQFARDACAELGSRLSAPTAELFVRAIERARRSASVAKQRLVQHDPTYDQDRDGYLMWIEAVLELKMAMLIQLGSDDDWVGTLHSTAFLRQLSVLDDIPLDLDNQLSMQVARKTQTEQALSIALHTVAVNQVISYLHEADIAEASRVHQLLLASWEEHPALAQLGQYLDYPAKMRGVEPLPDDEKRGTADSGSEAVLRRLQQQLPRSVVVRVRLAMVLAQRHADDEAHALAHAAARDGLTAELRKHAAELELQLSVRARGRQYHRRIEKLLEHAPDSPEQARSLADELGGLLREVEQDIASHKDVPAFSGLEELAGQIKKLVEQAGSAAVQLSVRDRLASLFEAYNGLMQTRPSSIDELWRLKSQLTMLLAKAEQEQRNPDCAPALDQLEQLVDGIKKNLKQIDQLRA